MPATTPARRLWVFYIPYVILAIGMLLGLLAVVHVQDQIRETQHRLAAEVRANSAQSHQACLDRIAGREALRNVITQAYSPSPTTPPEVVAQVVQRRDDLLANTPRLRCTRANEAVPVTFHKNSVRRSTTRAR